MVTKRTQTPVRDRARRRADAAAVAGVRIRLRSLSGGILRRLCADLCGPGLGDGGARVPVLDGRDFRVRGRVEPGDPPSQAERNWVVSDVRPFSLSPALEPPLGC